MQLRHINWIVKASKLCNLRCSYCYEWYELANKDRISLDGWRKILIAARTYHELRECEAGHPLQTNIIWHGGEPLLLPADYIRAVLAEEVQIFGEERLRSGAFRNALQTNLYHLQREHIELFKEGHFDVGVSFDLVSGRRLSVAGGSSETAVARNIDRLRDEDVGFGAIVVLAHHTAPHITDIYDFYEALGVAVRFLPLFNSPRSREKGIAISNASLCRALRKLFRHWIKRPDPVPVHPLVDQVYAVYLYEKGERQYVYDRRRYGEWAILVNTDGRLYQRTDAYDSARAMGNIFETSIEEILASPAYEESLKRDEVVWKRFCGRCEFSGPCAGLEAFESPRAPTGVRRCGFTYEMHSYILKYFQRTKVSIKGMERLLQPSP